jgi:ectoine hydroxylase-related dioxygenase (phytanoyl-CoA dioxygenase family)
VLPCDGTEDWPNKTSRAAAVTMNRFHDVGRGRPSGGTMTTSTDFALSAEELESLDRDGFVIRRNVFDPSEIADMVDHFERLVDRLVRDRRGERQTFGSYVFDADLANSVVIKWEGDTDVVHGIEPFAHLSPPLEAWANDLRLIEPMRQIVGHDELELFTEKLNLKRAHHGGANPLHQDYPYWINPADDASEVATTIIFLDDATIDNGCLWVVPGSHTQGQRITRTDGDRFAANEVDAGAYPDIDVVPDELEAGSTVSFGPFLVHRSAPNTSDRGRRALLYSYQPAGRRKQVDNLRRRRDGA